MCKVELRRFYGYVRQRYPQAKEIYVIQDCWPVHFLPSVCASANQQGITLVALPTYASWRNPIEKVWRWLKQTVIHMHPWADDWHRLKQEVQHFLDRFQMPNVALLRYIGLPNQFVNRQKVGVFTLSTDNKTFEKIRVQTG